MSVADKIAKQLATALNSEQIKEICDIILDDALCGGDNLQLFEPLLFPLALQARGRPIVKLVESVYVRIVTTRQQMQEFIAVGTALQCLLSVYLEDSSIFHCSCSIELPVLDGLPKFTLPITSRDELFTLSSFWLNTTISFARLGSFSESNRSDVSDIIAVMAYSSGKLQSPTSFMKVLASSVSMLLQRKTTLAFNATVGEGLLSWLIIGFNKLGGKSEAAVLIEKETAAFMVDTAQLVADAVGLIIKASESSLVNSFNSFIFLFIEDNLSPFTIAAQSNSPESIISVEVSKHYGYLLLQLYLETVQQSTSELFDCKSLFGVLINCCSNLDSYSLVARILIAGLNRDRKFVMAVKSVLLSAAVESNHPRKKQKVEG